MDREPGLESALRRHEELAIHLSGDHHVRVGGAPVREWGGASERNYVMSAISTMTHGHWPPPADEFGRVVMDTCRAVIARVSRTGSPDWSTVNFGPGHGVAGVSVAVADPLIGSLLPTTVTVSVWELDILDGDETASSDVDADAADPQWATAVRARLQAIAGPDGRDRRGIHRYRSSTGELIFRYIRLELLADHPAPRSMDEMADLALSCGRLATSSIFVYDMIEQRSRAAEKPEACSRPSWARCVVVSAAVHSRRNMCPAVVYIKTPRGSNLHGEAHLPHVAMIRLLTTTVTSG